MSNKAKTIATYAGIVFFFIFLAYGFVPQVLTGKIVNQSDISGYVGMANESNTWNDAHPDDRTEWTNSMFGGMPTTMLNGNTKGDWTQPLYNLLLIGKRPASYLLISLLGAFLLMLAFGINPLLAAGGAVAITFCSYNMQIIQVGHNAKMLALAYAPWVLAGVVFTYRSAFGMYRKKAEDHENEDGIKAWLPKTVLGAVLFALALGFQIKANHVQITYYLAIIILCYVVTLIIWIFAHKENRHLAGKFFTASALLLVVGIIGIASNANRLIPTYIYTQQTMRGGSELSQDGDRKSKGLDLEYATSWSYGWEELPNMMIANFNGGSSSGAVNPDKSATIKLLKSAGQTNVRQTAKALPMYWGPQPFTAGPMYMGAITVFLFVLGLLLYKGKEKWWLLVPTIIGIFLALGHNFMGFTKFWYNHIPFYSKFRTVSMALVILQITLPVLGFLVLDRIVKQRYDKKEFTKKGLIALGLTGGFCLLCWLFPGIAGSFSGASDSQMQEEIVSALMADRVMIFRQDALTSLFLIALSFALLWWSYLPKEEAESRNRKVLAALAICVMVLVNMFAMGKRYLNGDHFVTPNQFDRQFVARAVDKEILEDPELDYRVLDLSVSVFNDSHPSYFHKNIGGYSPVKLQRYQDLIDQYLTPEINSIYSSIQNATTIGEAEDALPALPVLSMLNDKYIILGEEAYLQNKNAMGACWFVDKAVRASSPNEEIALLGNADLHSSAIIGNDFSSFAEKIQPGDSLDTISLTSYAPNRLKYHYSAKSDRAAIFSEIYYPNGWTATVDGNPVDIFRANWTLRGAILPAGEHDVEMSFDPKSYKVSSNISRASSAGLLLLLILSIAGMYLPTGIGRKKE